MSESIDAELVCEALRMAIRARGVDSLENLIHQQYASEKLGRLISTKNRTVLQQHQAP